MGSQNYWNEGDDANRRRWREQQTNDVGMLASGSAVRRRVGCLTASVVIIAIGLALRMEGYRIGLPFVVVKYGGSLLWGSMVYFLAAALACRRSPQGVATLAFGLAVCVELFRLYHTPWLDAFRLTTVGALLLGRVFSLWNILAYALGIVLAAGLDHLRLASNSERR